MWVRMSKMVLFLLDLYLINPFLTFLPLLSSTPNRESCIMCQTVWWFIWLFVLIHGWVFTTFCNNLEMNFCVCFVASLWCLCAWYNTSMPSAEEWRVTHCWLNCCVIVYYIVCYIYLYACVPFISGVMMLQHTATLTFTITFTGQSEWWLLLYRTHKIATKKKPLKTVVFPFWQGLCGFMWRYYSKLGGAQYCFFLSCFSGSNC